MNTRLGGSLASALIAAGLCNCGAQPDTEVESPDNMATVSTDIINGDTVTTDSIGTPWLFNSVIPTVNPAKHGLCSSTLLSDRWLLTAHHCVTNDGSMNGPSVSASSLTATLQNGSSAIGTDLYIHPSSDVALVKLNQSLLSSTGRPWATPMFLGRSSDLNGPFQTVYCQGWGLNTYTDGWGTLRSAQIQVSQAESDGFTIIPTNGKIDWEGDSGSSCFVFINGHYNIVGVASTCPNNPSTQTVSSCHLVGADAVRAWVEAYVGNAAAVFSGQSFTGTSQQLLPGGPLRSGTLSRYDSAQLTVGDNAISSIMIPSSFPATLYQNPGFGASLGTASGQYGNMPSAQDNTLSSIEVSGGAKFFVDGNFGGASSTMSAGSLYSLRNTTLDNAISALTVPAGWTVTMYDNSIGTAGPGARAVFTEGSYGSIESAYNDRASYMVIQEPAALYVDKNYGGAVSKLLPGCYDMNQMGIGNDSVSSVFVPYGLNVQLFLNAGLNGSNTIYTTSQATLGSMDENASGVCVYSKPTAYCGTLYADEALLPNSRLLWSCDQRFYLTMQTDGNLVLYQSKNGQSTALWSTGTWQTSGQIAVLQKDGNFVLYDSNRNALWSSRTWDRPNAYLAVQNDGNLVVYQGTMPLWASNTCCH